MELSQDVGPRDGAACARALPLVVLKERSMWYFAWILGVLLAAAFGVINALWLETVEVSEQDGNNP